MYLLNNYTNNLLHDTIGNLKYKIYGKKLEHLMKFYENLIVLSTFLVAFL